VLDDEQLVAHAAPALVLVSSRSHSRAFVASSRKHASLWLVDRGAGFSSGNSVRQMFIV